ncbi:DUF4224 domain-containing protein [Seminibacterium arietis]|uniref:DUF4224 domain-containing protein n=1 Tax=Seminibacterium arietis TaxID=1173502 RepID=A0ABW3I695_9PAST
MDIHRDYLSPEELAYITGRKNKSKIKEQLIKQGIKFIQTASGYPIVRRDYDSVKTRSQPPKTIHDSWEPNIIKR